MACESSSYLFDSAWLPARESQESLEVPQRDVVDAQRQRSAAAHSYPELQTRQRPERWALPWCDRCDRCERAS